MHDLSLPLLEKNDMQCRKNSSLRVIYPVKYYLEKFQYLMP